MTAKLTLCHSHFSPVRAWCRVAGCVIACLAGSGPAVAQRDMVCHAGNVSVCIPGREPGSHLAKRFDDRLFYSPAGYRNWRPATVRDYPDLKNSAALAYRNEYYTVTPAGAFVTLDAMPGNFYRAGRPGLPKKLLAKTVYHPAGEGSHGEYQYPDRHTGSTRPPLPRPPWGSWHGINPHCYGFATEQFGYLHFRYTPWFHITHDGGVTWQRVGDLTSVSTGNGLYAQVLYVHFLTPKTGFGIVQMYKPTAEYLREQEGDTQNYNIGSDGFDGFYGTRLVRTADGGHTWERAKVAGDFHRVDYSFKTVRFHQAPGQPISFYCYGTSRIFESRDGGATFAPRPIKDFDKCWDRKVTPQQQCYVDSVHFAPFRVLFFNLRGTSSQKDKRVARQ